MTAPAIDAVNVQRATSCWQLASYLVILLEKRTAARLTKLISMGILQRGEFTLARLTMKAGASTGFSENDVVLVSKDEPNVRHFGGCLVHYVADAHL